MSKRFLVAGLVGFAMLLTGVARPAHVGYDDTDFLPGQPWRVHDSRRPQPVIVTPGTAGTAGTPDQPGQAPSDAIVLFDGTDLAQWRKANGEPAGWTIVDGAMEVPRENGGDIWTREEFGDCQLHIEWAAPAHSGGGDQGRGNSGVYLLGLYEVQVLDSYQNMTYADGQAAALYGQYPPLVNASRKPGAWQIYDILFTAPRFKGDELEAPATITMLHNGVVVHNHTELLGPTRHREVARYDPHGPKGPVKLQDHGHPVRYRNIWIRPLRSYDQGSSG